MASARIGLDGQGISLRKATLTGGAFSTSYNWSDADGLNWYNRVVGAGGSITNANQAVFDTAFQSMKANANIWSKLKQGYFFIGQQAFGTGLFVPFYNSNTGSGQQPLNTSPATNINITSSSYAKNVGLSNLPAQSGIDTGIANDNANWPPMIGSEGRSAYTFLSNLNLDEEYLPWSTNINSSNAKTFRFDGQLNGPTEGDDGPIPAFMAGSLKNNYTNPLNSGFGYSYEGGGPVVPMEGGFGISDNRPTLLNEGNYYAAGSTFFGEMFPSESPVYNSGTMLIASKKFTLGGPIFSDYHIVVASAFGVGGLDIPAFDTIVKALRTAIT
jgi:hypothetical protein